jgi:hypothetical protein
MNRVDKLKNIHLCEVLRRLGAWPLIKTHGTLSQSQRDHISGHADQLSAFLKDQGQPVPDEQILLELACLVPDSKSRNPSLLANLPPSEGGLTANDLEEASSWLAVIHAFLSFYYRSSPDQASSSRNGNLGTRDSITWDAPVSPVGTIIALIQNESDYLLHSWGNYMTYIAN